MKGEGYFLFTILSQSISLNQGWLFIYEIPLYPRRYDGFLFKSLFIQSADYDDQLEGIWDFFILA